MVISAGTCTGSVAALYSLYNSVNAEECHDCSRLGKRLPKARELPIYDKKDDFVVVYDKQSELPLINEISSIRLQLTGTMSFLNKFKEEAVHIYETGLAHSQSSFDYITQEENQIPRIITITSAGLIGVLLARKGGYIKKVFYGSIGSGLAFSALYPSTAREYLSSGIEYTKHHTNKALVEYGGYDTKKISEEVNEKLEHVKSALMLEGLTEKMKEMFEKNKENTSKNLKDASGNLKSQDNSSKTSS